MNILRVYLYLKKGKILLKDEAGRWEMSSFLLLWWRRC
ncbi:hypothetical protein DYE48_11905 [Halobacillus trueperi]|uniref:Uncharacterized protein n=1 Tax=Halobacillus trueperi TaxID=156205 RepID=A0A3E0J821_9BACI|nr:hypothetical protein DYE48_11905 [Halobacillus trueperi]